MADTTGIEWADGTVNIWTGCFKVSPACENCYAEANSPVRAMEMRIGDFLQVEPSADGKRRLKMWGKHGFRYEAVSWERELRRLNKKAWKARRAAEALGQPHRRSRVFINSLSDTFEDFTGDVYRLNDGIPEIVANSLDDVRERFFRVAEECTELDLLLLTKRPENVLRMAPAKWIGRGPCFECGGIGFAFRDPKCGYCPGCSRENLERMPEWPSHIWIGTTVENQKYADQRIRVLTEIPARVRFLSVEPLLGLLRLPSWLQDHHDRAALLARNGRWGTCVECPRDDIGVHPERCVQTQQYNHQLQDDRIHWLIVGCESGRAPRETKEEWVRALRDQCVENDTAFFYKQAMVDGVLVSLPLLDGKQWAEFPRTP
jgi:protein gp37